MKLKSLSLKKHERPITCVTFNREGDLLFSSSKDRENINLLLWNPENGDLVGNYSGHEGVVWFIDVNYNSTMIISASVDKTVRFWEVETGRCLVTLMHDSMVRCCRFSSSERQILSIQMRMCDVKPCIYIFDIDDDLRLHRDPKNQSKKCLKKLFGDPLSKKEFNSAVWTDLDRCIVASSTDGLLRKWDVESGELQLTVKGSDSSITNLQLAREGHLLVTTNLEGSAVIFLAESLTRVKEIKCDRPLHGVALSQKYPMLILGGGQSKLDVTLTSTEEGKLEVLFYDFVYEKLLGMTKNHFGPIYQIVISPNGSCYATGGEDSFLRVHYFNEELSDFFGKLEGE